MAIETTHNEHKIIYTHDDEWRCIALDLEAKTLSGLKKKLNEFDSKERKLGDKGVIVLYMSNYRYTYTDKPVSKVRATMLDKGESDNWNGVWITHIDSGSREKVGLHNLMHDTPENHQTIADAEAMFKEGQAMIRKAEKMKADIPRLTKDEIKAMALEVKPQ